MLKDRKRKDKKTYNDATKKQQTTAWYCLSEDNDHNHVGMWIFSTK